MPVANIRSRWNAGNLEFYDVATGTTQLAINAGGKNFNQYAVNAYMADGGTASSVFVTVPHGGTIKSLQAVNGVANATTKTVLTAKIATVAVTAPAWEIAVTAAAGTASAVVPTAANVITDGAVLELVTDGGSSSVMPVQFTILIER